MPADGGIERPGSPTLPELTASKTVYRVGEAQRFTITVPEDGYLYVGCYDVQGEAYLYSPNPLVKDGRVKRGEMVEIPPRPAEDSPGWQVSSSLPDTRNDGEEYVFAALCSAPLEGVMPVMDRNQRQVLEAAGIFPPGHGDAKTGHAGVAVSWVQIKILR